MLAPSTQGPNTKSTQPEVNKLASLEATLVETTTYPLADGGEV